MTTDFLLVQKIRNGNNQEYAEDIVQETFVRFFGALMSGADSPFKNATNREHSTGGGNTEGCISSVFWRKNR